MIADKNQRLTLSLTILLNAMYWKFRIPWRTLLVQILILSAALWVALAQWNLRQWLAQGITMNASVTLLFKKNLSPSQYERTLTLLRSDFPDWTIDEHHPEEILRYLNEQLGVSSTLTRSVRPEELPHSLDLRFHGGSLEEFDLLLQRLEQMPQIEQIIHARSLVKTLEWWNQVTKYSLWVWYLVCFLIVMDSLGGFIRHEMFRHREEVEFLRLAGVSGKHIFLEYLKEGYTLLLCLITASVGTMYLSYQWLVRWGYLGKYLPFPEQTFLFFADWDMIRGVLLVFISGTVMIVWRVDRSDVR